MSAPASATVRIWSSVAWTFAVSVLVIVWTATGAPPPTGTFPTWICRSEAIYQCSVGAARPGNIKVMSTFFGTEEVRTRASTATILGQVLFLVAVALGFAVAGTVMGRELDVGAARACSFIGFGML